MRVIRLHGVTLRDGYIEDFGATSVAVVVSSDIDVFGYQAAYYEDDYSACPPALRSEHVPALTLDGDGTIGPAGSRVRFLPEDGALRALGLDLPRG